MFTLLHSNIHLYVKFYVSCFHWWAMLSCTILHDIISVLPLRSTTPPKGVSSSLMDKSNIEFHMQIRNVTFIAQKTICSSLYCVLVCYNCSLMVPWKEQITFPVYHHPFQLVEISTFTFRLIPCYLFTISFFSFKLFSSSIYY